MLSQLVSTVFQLAIVLAIAGIFWAIFGRSKASFGSWIGLTFPPAKALLVALFAAILLRLLNAPLLWWPDWVATVTAGGTVIGMLRELGLSGASLMVLLLVGLIKTAFVEELFFRGLIAKRLIAMLGFHIGNIIQALIFGSIHILVFFVPEGPQLSLPLAAAFVVMPTIGGWTMGFVNERYGNGSILPGWILHGSGNVMWYFYLAYLL